MKQIVFILILALAGPCLVLGQTGSSSLSDTLTNTTVWTSIQLLSAGVNNPTVTIFNDGPSSLLVTLQATDTTAVDSLGRSNYITIVASTNIVLENKFPNIFKPTLYFLTDSVSVVRVRAW